MCCALLIESNPFPHDTIFDGYVADHFSKHCVKRRNHSWWAIYPFAIMFSTPTLFNTYSFIFMYIYYLEVFHLFAKIVAMSSAADLYVGKRVLLFSLYNMSLKLYITTHLCLVKYENNSKYTFNIDGPLQIWLCAN